MRLPNNLSWKITKNDGHAIQYVARQQIFSDRIPEIFAIAYLASLASCFIGAAGGMDPLLMLVMFGAQPLFLLGLLLSDSLHYRYTINLHGNVSPKLVREIQFYDLTFWWNNFVNTRGQIEDVPKELTELIKC